jgi:hypothetical protein
MASLPVTLINDYPQDIIQYLNPLLEIFYNQLTYEYNPNNHAVNHPYTTITHQLRPLIISSILFLSKTLKKCDNFMSNNESIIIIHDSASDETLVAFHQILATFFSSSKLTSILNLLLNGMLNYSSLALKDWNVDPESFYLEQQKLREKDNIKTASEVLYLQILDYNPILILSHVSYILNDAIHLKLQDITSHINHSHPLSGNDTMIDIFYWDVILLCIGLSTTVFEQLNNLRHGQSNDIEVNIKDFHPESLQSIISVEYVHNLIGLFLNTFFQSSSLSLLTKFYLTPHEFLSLESYHSILQTRILWLISCWMYTFNPQDLFQILTILIGIFESYHQSTQNPLRIDIMCFLTAIDTLIALINCSNFHFLFMAYLDSNPAVNLSHNELRNSLLLRLCMALCGIISEGNKRLKENDSIAHILNAIGELIRMLDQPTVQQLIQPLAQQFMVLWNVCETCSPLKTSIIEVCLVLFSYRMPFYGVQDYATVPLSSSFDVDML